MLRHAVVLLILALGVVIAFFYNQEPFDAKHQKRLFVIHMEDVSQFPFDIVVGVFLYLCWGCASTSGFSFIYCADWTSATDPTYALYPC